MNKELQETQYRNPPKLTVGLNEKAHRNIMLCQAYYKFRTKEAAALHLLEHVMFTDEEVEFFKNLNGSKDNDQR